jgi:hypothetical protein
MPKTPFSRGDLVEHVTTGECGVVIHAWSDAPGLQDCYVAFFGDHFPPSDGKPASPPYVLRYACTSLRHADRQPPSPTASQRSARRSQR